MLNSVNRPNVVALGTSVGKTGGSTGRVSPLRVKRRARLLVFDCAPGGAGGKAGAVWHSSARAGRARGSSVPLAGAQAGARLHQLSCGF